MLRSRRAPLAALIRAERVHISCRGYLVEGRYLAQTTMSLKRNRCLSFLRFSTVSMMKLSLTRRRCVLSWT